MNDEKRPTSVMIIKNIIRKPVKISSDEALSDIAAQVFGDDNDAAVYQAFIDLTKKPQRFQVLPGNPEIIECPRARLLRIGKEAIEEKNPSALYSFLMEHTQDGATLPHVTARALTTAQKRLTIANAFVDFMRALPSPLTANLMEAKREFRLSMAFTARAPSQAAVDDALAAHDLGWSSYDIKRVPKKRKKRGEQISCRILHADWP